MKLFVQTAAEEDILSQVEWCAEQGLPDVARRFGGAIQASLRAVLAAPQAGKPQETSNPALAGLRTWPVKGFELRVYYLLRPDLLQVIRVLHGKRDVDSRGPSMNKACISALGSSLKRRGYWKPLRQYPLKQRHCYIQISTLDKTWFQYPGQAIEQPGP